MPNDVGDTLVVGVAASALFDLSESELLLHSHGEAAYREYHAQRLDQTLLAGPGFALVQRLLALNEIAPAQAPLVEVVVLARSEPETGLRVLRSTRAHGVPVTRAIFTQDTAPYPYFGALDMSLFIAADGADARGANELGLLAGRVTGSAMADLGGRGLRIAFDVDTALGLDAAPGPHPRLAAFLNALSRVQRAEDEGSRSSERTRLLEVAVLTARGAPVHERAVRTLQSWGLRVNDAFFLGGMEKASVLAMFAPQIVIDGGAEGYPDLPGLRLPLAITVSGTSAASRAQAAAAQPVSVQAAPVQAAPVQPVSVQAAPVQATPLQHAEPQHAAPTHAFHAEPPAGALPAEVLLADAGYPPAQSNGVHAAYSPAEQAPVPEAAPRMTRRQMRQARGGQ